MMMMAMLAGRQMPMPPSNAPPMYAGRPPLNSSGIVPMPSYQDSPEESYSSSSYSNIREEADIHYLGKPKSINLFTYVPNLILCA
jgi:hypothetical protein